MTPATAPVGVGIVGCGVISAAYLRNAERFDSIRVVGCADVDVARAAQRSTEFGIPAYTVEELLENPAVELVVNITPPAAHVAVSRAALLHDRHVFSEKPLALDRRSGLELVELAADRGLMLGCAPDTVLGAGQQTARAVLDSGAIGAPVGAAAAVLRSGPERWHTNPAFLYAKGAGPLFDVGPYFITALATLLGPVRRVSALARHGAAERVVHQGPLAGTAFPVEVPTHVVVALETDSGAVASLSLSFDVWASIAQPLEVFGEEGCLLVPDPNTFGGVPRIHRAGADGWDDVPVPFAHDVESRILGAVDLAEGLRESRPPRASGELAFHVLDVMCAVEESVESGRAVEVASSFVRPPAMAQAGGAMAAAR